VFWAILGYPEQVIPLEAQELARKRAAIAQFVTQLPVIASFPLDIERLRPAPEYNFTRPPPPRSVLYDQFGWHMHSALWREEARRALASLELAASDGVF
jgi:hypothetical protein